MVWSFCWNVCRVHISVIIRLDNDRLEEFTFIFYGLSSIHLVFSLHSFWSLAVSDSIHRSFLSMKHFVWMEGEGGGGDVNDIYSWPLINEKIIACTQILHTRKRPRQTIQKFKQGGKSRRIFSRQDNQAHRQSTQHMKGKTPSKDSFDPRVCRNNSADIFCFYPVRGSSKKFYLYKYYREKRRSENKLSLLIDQLKTR